MVIKTLQSVKDACSRVGSDHRDLHSSVSKVGKAIDRSFVSDYDSTAREEVFANPESQTMINEVILQVGATLKHLLVYKPLIVSATYEVLT